MDSSSDRAAPWDFVFAQVCVCVNKVLGRYDQFVNNARINNPRINNVQIMSLIIKIKATHWLNYLIITKHPLVCGDIVQYRMLLDRQEYWSRWGPVCILR